MNPFRSRTQEALQNTQLRANLRGAMSFLRSKRLLSIDDRTEWQQHKQYASQLRREVIKNLPELLLQLETQCERNGIKVHWAEDAEQANQIILSIAKNKVAKTIVKGKSMASEEIGLNHFLAEHQIDCIESDMGEFIVQIANETPSHIIMPALHKSQEEIAQLFEEELNVNADAEDVDQLIGIGRQTLRNHFQEADIGLSGVNFAVAESGTLCLVENEGNGRMSTSVPNTHIAVMGLEKVIPSFEALPSLLYLLTRSATGQAITTYINFISGARREDERDGPNEVHLIILDNGRSNIAQSPHLNSTLACIRCGACMNHCPVYTRIGGHAYGSTYPGPIGQVVSPQLKGGETHEDLLSACSLNGACGEACPVEIDLPELIRTLRGQTKARGPSHRLEGLIWWLWRISHLHPRLYRLSSRMLSNAWLARKLMPKAWSISREAPIGNQETLHQRMKKRKPHE